VDYHDQAREGATMAVNTVNGLDEVKALVGKDLGQSSWLEITQERVNLFADATDDHQWIHVDPERAAAGPFGGPIAHGYLTLSLGPALLWEVLEVTDAALTVNYGLNRVRFPAPLPVGSRVRADIACAAVEEVSGGLQATLVLTFEREGGSKPVCVAEVLFRYGA
jgi:acyl dehydratase